MRNLTFLLALFFLNIQAMAQNIFDLNVHKIEIFFNINNWDDSLDIFYSNNLGERLIADSILIDVLNVIQEDEIALSLVDSSSSCLINGVKNKEEIYVVMPMRI